MANEFVIKNGYISKGNSQLSGSLDVSGSISASLGANTVGFYGTSSWAVSASWAPGATSTPGGLNTQIQFNSSSVFSGSSNLAFDYSNNTLKLTGSLLTTGSNTFIGTQIISGSINFGDGSKIQSISASSGDGGGYTTLTLKPDTSTLSDQYIVLDPTSPNHIHIRAGGVIDSSSAYLYLGGEKANVVVQNLDGSFNEKYWVQINAQTGSTQYTWTFDDDGTLLVPGNITGAVNLATTGSNTFVGTQTVTGSLFITGSNTLVGNTILSGTLQIQGEISVQNITASFISASSITGSLFGTASYAYTASYLDGDSIVINNNANNSLLTATGTTDTLDAEANLQFDGSVLTLTGNQITSGNQIITGSLNLSGSSAIFSSSISVTNGITGSLFGTASYAYTASYVNGMITKNNAVAGGTFAGNPKKATVTFATPFPNASYSVTITGEEARSWTIESKVSGSFIINSNSNTALANSVYWQAINYGEFKS